jgi:hypothetical protein
MRKLGALLGPLVTTTLAASCGGRLIDPSEFPPPTNSCTNGPGEPLLAPFLTPAQPVDYLEERVQVNFQSPDQFTVVSKTGVACSTATNQATCNGKLPTTAVQTGGCELPIGPCSDMHSIAYTRGDEVTALGAKTDIAAFLAPIDTPEEAILMAMRNDYQVTCARGGVKNVAGVWHVFAFVHDEGCGVFDANYELEVAADGTVTVLAEDVIKDEKGSNCPVARRPPGLRGDGSGSYFARAASAEAAAVVAFYELAVELEAHGAPAALVEWAKRAAREESGHAIMMARLAERFGDEPVPARVAATPVRSLEEIAIDNAAEGCVREAFGAAIALWQAMTASDPAVRAVMRRVADEEARHGDFAEALASWLDGQLDDAARRRVAEARARATGTLTAPFDHELDERARTMAGLPSRHEAHALALAFARAA